MKATAILKRALPEAHLSAAPELDGKRAGAPPPIVLEKAHKCDNCGVTICIPGVLDPVAIAAAQRQVLRKVSDDRYVTHGNVIKMRLRLGKAEERIQELTEQVKALEMEKIAACGDAENLRKALEEANGAVSHLQLQLKVVNDLWKQSGTGPTADAAEDSSHQSFVDLDPAGRISTEERMQMLPISEKPPVRPSTARPPSGRPITGGRQRPFSAAVSNTAVVRSVPKLALPPALGSGRDSQSETSTTRTDELSENPTTRSHSQARAQTERVVRKTLAELEEDKFVSSAYGESAEHNAGRMQLLAKGAQRPHSARPLSSSSGSLSWSVMLRPPSSRRAASRVSEEGSRAALSSAAGVSEAGDGNPDAEFKREALRGGVGERRRVLPKSLQQRRGQVWGLAGENLSTSSLPYDDFVSICGQTKEDGGSSVVKSMHLLLLSRWRETLAVTARSTEATGGPLWKEKRFRLCSACHLLDNVATLCGPYGEVIAEIKGHIYQAAFRDFVPPEGKVWGRSVGEYAQFDPYMELYHGAEQRLGAVQFAKSREVSEGLGLNKDLVKIRKRWALWVWQSFCTMHQIQQRFISFKYRQIHSKAQLEQAMKTWRDVAERNGLRREIAKARTKNDNHKEHLYFVNVAWSRVIQSVANQYISEHSTAMQHLQAGTSADARLLSKLQETLDELSWDIVADTQDKDQRTVRHVDTLGDIFAQLWSKVEGIERDLKTWTGGAGRTASTASSSRRRHLPAGVERTSSSAESVGVREEGVEVGVQTEEEQEEDGRGEVSAGEDTVTVSGSVHEESTAGTPRQRKHSRRRMSTMSGVSRLRR